MILPFNRVKLIVDSSAETVAAVCDKLRAGGIPYDRRTRQTRGALGKAVTAGRGVSARINGETWHFGNESFLCESGVSVPPQITDALSRLRREGKASVLAARDRQAVGVIALSEGEAIHMII